MTEDKHINICVAGCGHWGKNLLRNFHGLGQLYGVCEIDRQRLDGLVAQYPGVRAYPQWEDVLADPAIEAVVLATPAERHFSMGMAALQAGKDLFVEKPMALEAEDGLEMVEAARQGGRILMVGHLLQYHPAVAKIHTMLAENVLGGIDYIYSNRLSMGKIRREENALWSFAPHDISVILALMGQVPIQVSATGGAYLQPNIADITVSHLLFAKGTRAHVFVSWLHPYKEQRLVVIGTKQMVVFEDSRPENKLVLFDKCIEVSNGVMQAASPHGTPVPFEPEEPLRRECQHFVDCIRERRQPKTNGEEGVRVLQVLQACQYSLQINGEPVRVQAGARRSVQMI